MWLKHTPKQAASFAVWFTATTFFFVSAWTLGRISLGVALLLAIIVRYHNHPPLWTVPVCCFALLFGLILNLPQFIDVYRAESVRCKRVS